MNGERRFNRVSKFCSQREADQIRLELEVRRAWGDWLSAFIWTHFVTLTYRHQPSREAAIRDLRTWRRLLEQRAQGRVTWFYVLERGAAGALHLHALLHGTERLSTVSIAEAWHRGHVDAEVYDPRQGASYYLTKTVTSELAEYDIDPPPHPPCSPVDHGPPALARTAPTDQMHASSRHDHL